MKISIEIANETHVSYATAVCQLIAQSARKRGTGRAKRSPEDIAAKMEKGLAIIALCGEQLAGFSYLNTWDQEQYIVNTGLIVAPEFRGLGIASKIKKLAVKLATAKYPGAKMCSLTTSRAVMKMNTQLGYEAVTFEDLPQDSAFWQGCQSCPNFNILISKDYKMCLCTAMQKTLQNLEDALQLKKMQYEKR